MFEAIAGFDQNDPTSLQDPVPDMLAGLNAGVKGLRVGYDRRLASEGVDPGLVESIDQALETLQGLGATVVDVPMPQGIESLLEPWIAICSFEAHQAHQANFESQPEAFGPYFRDFLTLGSQVTNEQYAAASAQREAFNQQFNAMLASVDTVVCPAGGYTFSQEEYDLYADATALGPMFGEVQMYFTIPADFAGTPALTVPCGLSAEGLPYGLQFMGPALSESLLCRFGHAFEEATQWHAMHPPV
jgi:amidase